MHLTVPLHGRGVEVPRAALEAELQRDGAIASLALIEAVGRHAPRDLAVARLQRGLDSLSGTIGLSTLLWLVRLDAREAVPKLRDIDVRGPLRTTAHIAAYVLDGDLTSLAAELTRDEAVLLRTPFVLAALPRVPHASLFDALLSAVERIQPTLGATAYRSLLGDVAEALYRVAQLGGELDGLLGDHRDALVDRLTAELQGTPDLVAARGMAWALGVLAKNDDSARTAIERARDRFRDPAFAADCSAMLSGAWPP